MKFHSAATALGSMVLCTILAPTVTDAHSLCWSTGNAGRSSTCRHLLLSVFAATLFISIPPAMAQEGAQEHQEQQEHLYLRRREEACCVCIRAPCDCACDPSSNPPPKKSAPYSTGSWPVVLTSSPDLFPHFGVPSSFSFPSETFTTTAASFPFGIGFPASNVAGPQPSGFSALDLFGPSLGAYNGNDRDAPGGQPFVSSTLVPVFTGSGTIPPGPTLIGPPCGDPPCPITIVGRPFVDTDGLEITSDASICAASAWTTTFVDEIPPYDSAKQQYGDEQYGKLSKKSGSIDRGLATEWTNKAIGEHASIASFAAFTINLMSNQAPPDLIRDSLNAAMDELNHAVTSFEIASLLTGQPIQPGKLPPSKHAFEKNLTALALATAQEGCIAETLSALELAMEVDRAAADADADDVSTMLMRKTKIIALEEGGHSVLAWRTIHWICSTNSAVCNCIKREVLETTKLAGATKAYSDGIGKAWSRIYESLVPFVTMKETLPIWTSELDCTSTATTVIENKDEFEVTELLVRNILKGVYCAIQSSGSLAAET
jgi:hypothetical protein